MIPPVYSVDDIAKRLGKSRRWVLDYVRKRADIGGKAGRDWRFNEADVALLVAEVTCPSSSTRRARKTRAGRFAYVPDTKNGEPRAVFLPPVAVSALANMASRESRIFPFAKGGHLYSLLRVVAAKAGVDLPERSAFHIFRHTYATWMRRYAGLDTRGLVGTGAWKDLKSAARYAHVEVTEESKRAVMLPVGAGRGKAQVA